MSVFPTTFTDMLLDVADLALSDTGAEALAYLQAQDYGVLLGLSEDYAQAIASMALEPAIQEYCPKDSSERFHDLAATTEWLQKGRAAVLLVKHTAPEESRLAGYGWIGDGASDLVPGGQVTFAMRIGEADQGHGLATPYLQVLIAAARAEYQATNIWLETWASNGGAVHVYHKVGFVDVAQRAGTRPSRVGQTIDDTRLFMQLPD